MSNEDFDAQILSEKLSKLNNSQQSIESLSQWCVSHRKKAKQIVETWDKLFNSSPKEKCISFLYLANDILQNSRRKGSEFVSEFWKVLPAALKHVYREGEEPGKKVVTRLVDIWEERKVFGSRGHGLKDELLGKDPSPQSASNGKSSNPIKIVKRDASSVRIKLAVGGLPEKILTAFQSVLDEDSTEEVALSKCNAAADYVGKIEEDAEKTLLQGNQQGHGLVDDLHEQENILNQCIAQMEISEATRSSLISQLKEALNDQELKLELIRTQLQIARNRIQQASNLRKRLTSPSLHGTITSGNLVAEMPRPEDQNLPLIQPTSTPLHPLALPMMSFSPLKNADEENKKAAVAAVAAKLAASTSSAQMLTSVLSSLVAEEAASMNGSSKSVGFGTGLPMFPPEKRPKLERPMLISDVGKSDIGNSTYFTPLQPQSTSSMPIAPSAGMQLPSHSSQLQTPFTSPPPPPPAPLSSVPPTSANSPANQYVQSAAMMAGVMPFGYGTNPLPPPPPLPPHMAMNLARPASQQPQQSQPEQSQQQQPSTGGYYRPPGLGFFGQNHQPATPPLPRQ